MKDDPFKRFIQKYGRKRPTACDDCGERTKLAPLLTLVRGVPHVKAFLCRACAEKRGSGVLEIDLATIPKEDT